MRLITIAQTNYQNRITLWTALLILKSIKIRQIYMNDFAIQNQIFRCITLRDIFASVNSVTYVNVISISLHYRLINRVAYLSLKLSIVQDIIAWMYEMIPLRKLIRLINTSYAAISVCCDIAARITTGWRVVTACCKQVPNAERRVPVLWKIFNVLQNKFFYAKYWVSLLFIKSIY